MYCVRGNCLLQCDMCKSDFEGKDHWSHCDDPLNCNCEELVPCLKCNGNGQIRIGVMPWDEFENCPYCEDGLMHVDDSENFKT